MNYLKKVVLVILCLNFALIATGQTHPNIMLTRSNLDAVRKGVLEYPLLKKSFGEVKKAADMALASAINVPVPADGGGGSSHEQHKRNYQDVLSCGIAYQISQDKRYAEHVKKLLMEYAANYEKWPLKHPKSREDNQTGRIFWQILNDCVWQVHVIQGYDLVYDALTAKERRHIESRLFEPVLKYITQHSSYTFNRIHNHGTWAVAAVGLTGYVLNKPHYVEMALKGADRSGKSGYLIQLDKLFSPNGYYTEGPYYQRYALLPFVIFAKAIHQYQPELQIYNYRNKILEKAINTSLQSTYTNGAFFPINDAIKDKTFESSELVYGTDLAYADMAGGADLLDVAQKQGRVIVSDAGLKVARDIAERKSKPFNYQSLWIGDGNAGNEGGLGILRYGSNDDQQCLLFKAAAQGMGHGHFDRLNILYYDNGTEVFSDYGAARFINIETKGGGGYLPENKTWAKQTIAHNTLVVDQTSAFKGKLAEAEKSHPELLFFKPQGEFQAVSAKEDKAYPGVSMIRTSLFLPVEGLERPLLVDIFKAESASEHQYDLPFWYNGHITNTSFEIKGFTDILKPMGNKHGYEHIWLSSESDLSASGGFITALNKGRFYTTHFTSGWPMKIKTGFLGANDPDFNLLSAKAFILSRPSASDNTFISVTESHGAVDPVNETITSSQTSVTSLKLIASDKDHTRLSFQVRDKAYELRVNYNDKNNFIQLKK